MNPVKFEEANKNLLKPVDELKALHDVLLAEYIDSMIEPDDPKNDWMYRSGLKHSLDTVMLRIKELEKQHVSPPPRAGKWKLLLSNRASKRAKLNVIAKYKGDLELGDK